MGETLAEAVERLLNQLAEYEREYNEVRETRSFSMTPDFNDLYTAEEIGIQLGRLQVYMERIKEQLNTFEEEAEDEYREILRGFILFDDDGDYWTFNFLNSRNSDGVVNWDELAAWVLENNEEELDLETFIDKYEVEEIAGMSTGQYLTILQQLQAGGHVNKAELVGRCLHCGKENK